VSSLGGKNLTGWIQPDHPEIDEDLKLAKKDSEKTENTPADAGKDSETEENDVADTKEDAETELPWPKDTDKYKVGKALIAGETDRNKMIRELGVSVNTIYNVTAELTANGYVLAIHQKKRIPPPPHPLSTSTSHYSSQSLQTTPNSLSELTPEQINALLKLLSPPRGDSGENKLGEKTSPETSPEISPAATPAQNPPQDLVKLLAVEVVKVLGVKAPEGQQLHGQPVPFEDVEIVGEKVNYKVALNPEVFYRYSVFNALLNLRLAR
jgi:hypothetical protein